MVGISNFRHAQYDSRGIGIDSPQDLFPSLEEDSFGNMIGLRGRSDSLLPSTPPRILKRCIDTVGIGAANSGTAATVSIDAASPFGRPAYKVAMPAGNTWHEVQLFNLGIANFDGHVMWRIWVGNHTAVQQIQTFAGTTAYSRFWQGIHRLNNSNENRWDGEHVLRAGPTFASGTNTFLIGADTLAECKIRIFPGAAGADVWVEAIFIPSVGRPTHILTYDDCSVTWINNILPDLAANRLRGTFGINTNDIGGSPSLYLSSAQVAQIASAGHQISPHNQSNDEVDDGSGSGSSPLTTAAYTAQFVAASAALSAIIGQRLDTTYHPWVQGFNNQAVHDTMRAAGMRIGRGTDNANGYNFPQVGLGNGVMALKNQSLHTFTTFAAIDAVVDIVNRYGLTVVWMTHEVLTTGGSDGIGGDVETNVSFHRYLCQRLARDRDAGRCAVPTAGQFAQEVYANRLVAASLL